MNAAAGRVSSFLACLCDSARLMVGVPRYEDYVAHMARTHPEQAPMTYPEFVSNRQAARFGGVKGGGLRCC